MGIFSAGKSKRISFFSGERWIRHLDYFQLCTPSFHNISIGGKLLSLFAQVVKMMETVLHKSAKIPSRTSVEILYPY